MISEAERAAVLDLLSPRIDDWAALWWGEQSVRAAALGHPWQRVQYSAGMLQVLNMALRPYRYTMRRKIRKVFG